jgi:nanoRNase/pAp phosphatase (c-di-AMP/oligoRNAs hydrolase)
MRNESFISLLSRELSQLASLRVSILTHAGGDPDSICSAYCLKKILKETFNVGNVWISVPDSPTAHTKALVEYFQIEVTRDVRDVDAYIVVDVGSPEQLDEYFEVISRGDKQVIVIDHHSNTVNRYPPTTKVYSSEYYQSTSEIIYDLAEYTGFKLGLLEAEAILIGMYYDTARLSIADSETSHKLCRLIDKGVSLGNVLAKLEQKIDISERIARLKGAARMKIYRFRDWLVVVTIVGGFQSSVARSLINLGAHLAIAIGEVDKSRVTASIRASQEFVEQNKINVGVDLAERLGIKLGGHGGGHASAAHLECKTTPGELAYHFIDELANRLNIKPEVLGV